MMAIAQSGIAKTRFIRSYAVFCSIDSDRCEKDEGLTILEPRNIHEWVKKHW
jgi:hypothetical protein